MNAAEIQVQRNELNRDSQRSELLRTLNLNPSIELTGVTQLITAFPTDVNQKTDLEYALEHRPDLKIVKKQLELAKLAEEMAENNLLPTVRIGGKYSSRGQGRYPGNYGSIVGTQYPEAGVEFSVRYPLWDEGAKVDVRNARISMHQLKLQKEEIHRQVGDDIALGYKQMKVAFESYQKARSSLRETEAFYRGLLRGYRNGRFAAVAVKNVLDGLVQARQGVSAAAIQYNIVMIRYDMVRNQIFKKSNIDIDEVISRMENHIQ